MTSEADRLPGEMPLQQICFGYPPEKSGRSLSSPVAARSELMKA
jgi:hypothetical protein